TGSRRSSPTRARRSPISASCRARWRRARPRSIAWRRAWTTSASRRAPSTRKRCRESTCWSSSCSATRACSTACSTPSTTIRRPSSSGRSAASPVRASRASRMVRARPMQLRTVYIVCLAVCIAAAALAACGGLAPGSSSSDVTQYDFGPMPERSASGLRESLLVYDVTAPGWLDSPSIYYRLAYQDATRPQAYADSRWVGSPAELIGARVRGRLAASGKGGVVHPADGMRASYALRVELDEFIQVFDAPGKSKAVVRLRATVLGKGALLAQKSFSI